MSDGRAIVSALEKTGFVGPRLGLLNPTWNAALGKPSLMARGYSAIANPIGTGANKALSGAGYVAGLPFRPFYRGAGLLGKGGAYLGAQAGQGALKSGLGIAGRAPGATAMNIGFLGLGGLGLSNAAYNAGKQEVDQTAGMFLKGASVMNRREQLLRAQSESFVKTSAGRLDSLFRTVTRAVGGGGAAAKGVARSGAKRADRPAKATAPHDFASIATTLAALTAFGGAMGTGLKAADAVVDLAADKALRGNKHTQYVHMLREDPELAKNPKSRKYFDMVYRASNYVSSEPVLAAGAVRSMVNQTPPDYDGRHAPDLSDKALQVLKLEGERQKSRFPFSLGARRSDIPSTVSGRGFDIAPSIFPS